MRVFLVRYFCGSLGIVLLFLYIVFGLQIQIEQTKAWYLIPVIVVFPGLVHAIRLKNVPIVHFEVLTCTIEVLLVTMVAIVCLTLLSLLGNFLVFILGLAVALVALLIYPSHVLRWDYDHHLR